MRGRKRSRTLCPWGEYMKRLYPWEDWLKVGTVRVLTKGREFHVDCKVMAQQVRQAACARKLFVEVLPGERKGTLVIRPLKKRRVIRRNP